MTQSEYPLAYEGSVTGRPETYPPESAAIEEAISWLLRIHDGFSQPDFREWREWLNEDPAHADAFDLVGAFWREAELDGDLPWPTESELAADTYDGTTPLPLPDRTLPVSSPRRKWRYAWPAIAASVLVIIAVGFQLFQLAGMRSTRFETTTAQHQTVALQDGSSITLGAESTVMVAFDRHTRHVELQRGAAYFRVEEDVNRPFVVAAGIRTVRALGTEFDINIGVRGIRVAVVEGVVRVEGPTPAAGAAAGSPAVPARLDLGSGDVMDFGARDAAGMVSRIDPRLSTSWLNGRLAYDGVPLETVVADVNRYTESQVIVGDEFTRQLLFTGTIFSDDIDNWLIGLEDAFPLQLVTVDEQTIILIRRRN